MKDRPSGNPQVSLVDWSLLCSLGCEDRWTKGKTADVVTIVGLVIH